MRKCKNCRYHIKENKFKSICGYTYDISKLILSFSEPEKDCLWKEMIK
jgi:hypothetical protein